MYSQFQSMFLKMRRSGLMSLDTRLFHWSTTGSGSTCAECRIQIQIPPPCNSSESVFLK